MSIYLDHAAATPVDEEVMAVILPYFSERFHNPSALYGPATEVSRALEQARAVVANELGAKSTEIIFTAGGTEANNLAIHGIMQKYPQASVAYSAVEHDSVRAPAGRHNSVEIPVDEQGIVQPETLRHVISDDMVLVSIMYANNEIGTVQPIRRIAQVVEDIRKSRREAGNELPLYFHTDAAQAGNYLDMHVSRLGVDVMTINGGKLYGPKQSGVLFVATGVGLDPIIHGGGQERNMRSGTENVAGAVGLARALQKAGAMRHDETERLHSLNELFMTKLQETFPDSIINGSTRFRLPNNVHVTLPGTDNERILMALDMEGIYAAAGSACSASHDEPSHVLATMGCDDAHIRSSLRFSLGRGTTQDDIEQTVAALQRIIA